PHGHLNSSNTLWRCSFFVSDSAKYGLIQRVLSFRTNSNSAHKYTILQPWISVYYFHLIFPFIRRLPLFEFDVLHLQLTNRSLLGLNITSENPPVYCPPTIECQTIRSQPYDNICAQPQGTFEPIVCPAGFYCPPNGQEKIRCPSGFYCPLGSFYAKRCRALSVCHERSEREVSLIGIACLIAIYMLLLLLVIARKLKAGVAWKKLAARWATITREGNSHNAAIEEVENCSIFDGLIKDRGMADVGIELDMHQLEVTLQHTGRPILDGISGNIKKGCVFGIMGLSGAGKTTLINILAGKSRQTSGTTALNGVQGDLTRFKHLIGFVPQDDILLEELTVRESILHSARLHLGGVWSDDKIKLHVNKLIDYLGLTPVKDQLAGGAEKRGISGGERKRLSIALELAAMPRAVILDEPTSGLDAATALSIMKLLKSISLMGITVVCTIHQPRSDIFHLLDDLLILASGRQVYLGQAARVKEYFKALGYAIPSASNPADIVMDIVSSWQVGLESFRPLSPQGSIEMSIEVISEVYESRQESESVAVLDKLAAVQRAPWHRQLLLYLLCGTRQRCRQVFGFILGMVTASAAGLLIGLGVYGHQGHVFQGYYRQPFHPLSSAVNYTSLPSLAQISCLAISLAAAPAGIRTIAEEKLVFYREIRSGHSSTAYFLGKELSTWPRVFLSALHFTTFYSILATPVVPFEALLLLNTVYFFCIYGIASLVASLVRRQDALLLAMLASMIAGIFNGAGPLLSRVKSWNMAWFWYICPSTWYSEAFFSEHTTPWSYLYDVNAASSFVGYVTGRTPFDLG
ncbi:ABC transporter, partial [Aspergillus bombycis]